MQNKTLYNLISQAASMWPEKTVFRYRQDNAWKDLSYGEYFRKANALAAVMSNKGINKGDMVASYATNGIGLNILDLALLKIGALHAMYFPNYNALNLKEVIRYAKPKAIFAGTGIFLSNIENVLSEMEEKPMVFALQKTKKAYESLDELLQQQVKESLEIYVDEKDPYAIYFTSGTTGSTKGVMVTNQAIVATIASLQSVFPISQDETSISIAPMSVSSERCLNYFYQCSGVTTYYPENMESLIPNIQDAKPSIFLTSPLMLNKIKDNIYLKMEEMPAGFKKKLFTKAIRFTEDAANIYSKNPVKSFSRFLYSKLIYSKLKGILGGKVKYIVSGGANSSKDTLVFYHNIGIPVYEGYGMTECHIIAVNRPDEKINTFDNVGKPFGETMVKISPDGEVLCKSPYMFYEYFKLPETTEQSFTEDGYFKTGDKGKISRDGNLEISGRIKNIFKTQAGIYINPEGIESFLAQGNEIEQAVIYGDGKKALVALIQPAEKLNELQPEERYKLINAQVERYNKTKVEAEQIAYFHMLEHPFSTEKGEMTASSKPVRAKIEQHYQNELNRLYELG